MFRNGMVLAGGKILNALLGMARNILIARLIGVEDFGVASTFLVMVAFIDMISDLALNQLIVQDKRGEERSFVAAVQGLVIARGFLLGAVMFLAAGPLAALFGNQDIVWAYQCLALAPVFMGFINQDVMRMQRAMGFRALVSMELIGAALTLAAAWPLCLWLNDFRAMLVVVIAQYAARAVASQFTAERRMAARWDRTILPQALRFGLPFLASGPLTFAVMQGDRIIVANQFTAYDLGLFSAALSITMLPAMQAMFILRTFFLPLLSRAQNDDAGFAVMCRVSQETLLIAGAALAAGTALLGPPVFVALFGDDYAGAAPFLALLGALFALRIMRVAPTNVTVARARTRPVFYANLTRAVSLPAAWAAAVAGAGIETVLLIGIAAELGSLAYAAHAARRVAGPAYGPILTLPALLGLGAVAAAAASGLLTGVESWVAAGLSALITAAMVPACAEMRRWLRRRGAAHAPTAEKD